MLQTNNYTFRRRGTDVFFHEPGHVVVEHHTVQSPALMSSCDLLPHSGQETLWKKTQFKSQL